MNSKLEKWLRWIEIICNDIKNLCCNQHVFLETEKIIKLNNSINIDNPFYDFFYDGFTSIGVMGVRRQIKIHNDSISLARLIKEIHENSTIVSEHWISKMNAKPEERELIVFIIEEFCDSGANHIDPEIVKRDLELLQQSSKSVEGFADRRLAHADRRNIDDHPTFRDLHECINLVKSMAEKYRLLLTGYSGDLKPIILNDWKTIFNVPWIKSKT